MSLSAKKVYFRPLVQEKETTNLILGSFALSVFGRVSDQGRIYIPKINGPNSFVFPPVFAKSAREILDPPCFYILWYDSPILVSLQLDSVQCTGR